MNAIERFKQGRAIKKYQNPSAPLNMGKKKTV